MGTRGLRTRLRTTASLCPSEVAKLMSSDRSIVLGNGHRHECGTLSLQEFWQTYLKAVGRIA